MAQINLRNCICLLGLAAITLTGCAEETTVAPPFVAPTPEASVAANTNVAANVNVNANVNAPQPTPADASFFMTVPFDPAGNQTIDVFSSETAFMSVAALNTAVPVENWMSTGWAVGTSLGESDMVPLDCALHTRQGVERQIYAACPGPGKISIPHEAGDFVYIVFTDAANQIARVVQTGALYNPDTTGLIP